MGAAPMLPTSDWVFSTQYYSPECREAGNCATYLGMGGGCTLPQSGPLYTDEELIVYSMDMVLEPACIVPTKCTFPMA